MVSFDQAGTPSLLKPLQAFRWFIDYGGRHGTNWINSVTRVIPSTSVPYHPMLCAPFVKTPTLLMVAPEDEMVHANYSVSRQTYELLSGPKQWYDIAVVISDYSTIRENFTKRLPGYRHSSCKNGFDM